MAILATMKRDKVQTIVRRWQERCLLADGSLLFEDKTLWTPENLGRLHEHIVGTPVLDSRSFIEKFKVQLGSDRQLVLLGAEVMVVYYLFVWRGAVGPRTKQARISEILGWADESLPEDGDVWAALGEDGIGHPGQYYLLRPDTQLGFLAEFARRLKEEPEATRAVTLADPWALRDFMEEGVDGGVPGMRHILLHLLHPETFERIASGPHKRRIASAYVGLIDGDDTDDDDDERLLAIRGRLQELLGLTAGEMDFYEEPLVETWLSGPAADGSDPLAAIDLKKQLVYFGPPGTSKTYEAKALAKRIIRHAALTTWGPATYFERQAEVELALDGHIRRLQLHPAYSYEEFIRGLRFREGKTEYQDGYLLRLVDEIEQAKEGAESPLPWVLILDELNRADLSRVFGEAFSALEDRENPVDLPGAEVDEPTRALQLPKDLYVIGTMNLIDQSLEQVDFALRRRFLWVRSGFDAQRLAEVLAERWRMEEASGRYEWSRLEEDMALFTERAKLLNEHIGGSALLGRDYEIGHTYFFDVIGLLACADYLHRKRRTNRFLWRDGEGQQPVVDLWRMSLEPLLDQYLQGVDAEARHAELERLRSVFLAGKPA